MINNLYNIAATGNAALAIFFLAKAGWNITLSETPQGQMALAADNKSLEKPKKRYRRYLLGAVGTALNAGLLFQLA